jgi:hypothetical protein
MKRITFLTCIGSLGLALTALGAPDKPATKAARKSAPAVSVKGGGHSMSHAAPMRTSRGFSGARMHTMPTAINSARFHARNNVAVSRERNINRANQTNTMRNSRVEAARTTNTMRNSRMETARTANANANAKFGPRTDVAVNRNGNISGTRTQAAIAQRNAPIVNNWQNVSGQNYAAFRDYRRQWHDRNWWQNNYSRIILVGGGWWYWNDGYWYPAWGYDPYYTYDPYDGPIYGYGDLTPDQVIVNVQT